MMIWIQIFISSSGFVYFQLPSLLDRLSPYPLVRKLLARITSIMYAVASGIDSLAPNEYTGKAKYYVSTLTLQNLKAVIFQYNFILPLGSL